MMSEARRQAAIRVAVKPYLRKRLPRLAALAMRLGYIVPPSR